MIYIHNSFSKHVSSKIFGWICQHFFKIPSEGITTWKFYLNFVWLLQASSSHGHHGVLKLHRKNEARFIAPRGVLIDPVTSDVFFSGETVDGNHKFGKLTSWGKGSLTSHYLPRVNYTSQRWLGMGFSSISISWDFITTHLTTKLGSLGEVCLDFWTQAFSTSTSKGFIYMGWNGVKWQDGTTWKLQLQYHVQGGPWIHLKNG